MSSIDKAEDTLSQLVSLVGRLSQEALFAEEEDKRKLVTLLKDLVSSLKEILEKAREVDTIATAPVGDKDRGVLRIPVGDSPEVMNRMELFMGIQKRITTLDKGFLDQKFSEFRYSLLRKILIAKLMHEMSLIAKYTFA